MNRDSFEAKNATRASTSSGVPLSYPVPLSALSPLYLATAPDGTSLNGKGELSKAVLDPQLGKDLWTWLEDQVTPLEA
ncbi:hypothetical protein BDQ17DRAFT_1542054 [Cyathus striatus]|nr:hypothetical protein BDQ17DRAFT_1542054 [Cyathus striatus]